MNSTHFHSRVCLPPLPPLQKKRNDREQPHREDLRKLFGLITCGEIKTQVSVTLQISTAEWLFLPGLLVEIDDALGVLGVDRVVPIVVRVLVLERQRLKRPVFAV